MWFRTVVCTSDSGQFSPEPQRKPGSVHIHKFRAVHGQNRSKACVPAPYCVLAMQSRRGSSEESCGAAFNREPSAGRVLNW